MFESYAEIPVINWFLRILHFCVCEDISGYGINFLINDSVVLGLDVSKWIKILLVVYSGVQSKNNVWHIVNKVEFQFTSVYIYRGHFTQHSRRNIKADLKRFQAFKEKLMICGLKNLSLNRQRDVLLFFQLNHKIRN
jgi:hypothetical protein